MSKVLEKNVTLINAQGLHTRPAKAFVEIASKYECRIEVIYKNVSANGKSIMGLLGLLAYSGCELTIRATGDDAEKAIEALSLLVESGFKNE